MLRRSLLSTAGFLTLAVTLAGAFRMLPEEPMRAQILPPVSSPSKLATPPANLPPVHPDEPTTDTLNQRFTLNDALDRIQQIRSALNNFSRMTSENPKRVNGIGDTSWETQNLGFPNWTNSVEGTLRYQDYQLKQLEFELARKQFQDGEISRADLEKKQAAFQKSEQDFRAFWRSFKIAD